jgi:hypothetical protein
MFPNPFKKGHVPWNKQTQKVCRVCRVPIEATPRQLRRAEYFCPLHKRSEQEKTENLLRLKINNPKWRVNKANLAKIQAHKIIHKAKAKGELFVKDACEKCGATSRLEMHHEDYSQPLVVKFLCKSCHGKADYMRRALSNPVSAGVF